MLDNKIGRYYWPTKLVDFCMTDKIFVGRFYWQTKSANFIDRLTSTLVSSWVCHSCIGCKRWIAFLVNI